MEIPQAVRGFYNNINTAAGVSSLSSMIDPASPRIVAQVDSERITLELYLLLSWGIWAKLPPGPSRTV